jgi:hypothetical protein
MSKQQEPPWFGGEVDHEVVRQIVALRAKERDETLAGSGDDLVKRFLHGFKTSNTGYPLWVRVKDAFGHGSNVSQAICRKYGFDPDLRVKQRRI